MQTVLTDLIGKRVVIVAQRFFYRGLLVEERGPYAILRDATKVLYYEGKELQEEVNLREARVNVALAEAIDLETNTDWAAQPSKVRR